MKNLLLLLAFLYATSVMGANIQPTIKGQGESLKKAITNLQVPNKQATKTGPNTYIAKDDCGNSKNILENCGFEHETYSTSWGLEGAATFDVEEANVIDGLKSLKITAVAQAWGLRQESTLYQSQFTGNNIECFTAFRIKTDHTGAMFYNPTVAGSDLLDLRTTIEVTGGVWSNPIIMPFKCGATSNGIFIYGAAGTGTTLIDEVILAPSDFRASDSVATWQEPDSVLYAAGNAGQVVATSGDIPFTASSNKGSDLSFNGTTVTALKSGIYSISVSTNFTTTLQRSLILTTSASDTYRISDIGATASAIAGSITIDLDEGESFAISSGVNGGTLSNSSVTHFLKVTKQSTLKQVNVNRNQKITIPTSELRFEGASSRGTGANTAIVKFDTVAKIRGDAFEYVSDATFGTVVTMKKKGKLDVSTSLRVATSALFISLNQSVLTTSPVASEALSTCYVNFAATIGNCAWSGHVNVGDIIRIAGAGTPSADAFNNLNLSFQEQEVQVSVSNTLPQFSESDIVVRGSDNASQIITASSNIPFTTVEDSTGGAWNGSQFTVPETGVYHINGSVYANSTAARRFYLTINGALGDNIATYASDTVHNFNFAGKLIAGQVVSIRNSASFTLVPTPLHHYINITKVGKPNVTGVDVTPFVEVPVMESQSLKSLNSGTNYNLTNVDSSNGSGLFVVSSSTTFTALKRINVFINANLSGTTTAAGGNFYSRIRLNGTIVSAEREITASSGAGTDISHSAALELNAGDIVTIAAESLSSVTVNAGRATIVATATPDTIVTPVESFSTDSANLHHSATACLTTDIGCFNTYSYTFNTNTKAICPTAPAQTTAHMNANGIQIFTRAYNVGSSCGSPARVELVVGKGFKGSSIGIFKNAGKDIGGNLEGTVLSSVSEYGARISNYDPSEGVLTVDVAMAWLSTNTSHSLTFRDNSNQTNGYLVFNASKTPTLSGLSPDSKQTVKSIGAVGPDIQSVLFGASSGCATACTTGTCFICNSIGSKITSVTYTGTGAYNLNGIDGFKYNCSGAALIGATYNAIAHNITTSTATYARIQNAAGNFATASVTCLGIP
jgi:hypothetical protein